MATDVSFLLYFHLLLFSFHVHTWLEYYLQCTTCLLEYVDGLRHRPRGPEGFGGPPFLSSILIQDLTQQLYFHSVGHTVLVCDVLLYHFFGLFPIGVK